MKKQTPKKSFLPQRRVISIAWRAMVGAQTAQLAAGVAYFGTLSLFPLMAGLVALAGLVLTGQQVIDAMAQLQPYLPVDIYSLILAQLKAAVTHQQANAVVATLAFALTLFGASGAMESLVRAINMVYGQVDKRPFIKQKLLSFGLTLGLMVGMVAMIPLILVGDTMLRNLGISPALVFVLNTVRWLILLVLAVVALGVVYYYSLRTEHRWRWISRGSVVATALWLVVTGLLFTYLHYFANLSSAYSLFAGIIATMIWINFSALAVLVGASVDSDFDKPQR